MSIIKGDINNLSAKNNINIKKSTEYKLIGVDDTMPNILRSEYFIE